MANCYVNPLIFLSHLDFNKFSKEDLMELRLDILQNCDKLIIAGEISRSVQAEIEFAKEDRPLSSEEENSQQDAPPEEMLEKIKKAVEDARK